jgi:hypothetical protein
MELLDGSDRLMAEAAHQAGLPLQKSPIERELDHFFASPAPPELGKVNCKLQKK